MRKYLKKWLRGIAFSLVGLLGLVTFVVPAQQAAASPVGYICVRVWQPLLHRWIWRCWPIPVLIDWDWKWKCPQCGLAINWREQLGDPDPLSRINETINEGLLDLGHAAFAQDPAEQIKLREAALESFTTAAHTLGRTSLNVGEVGVVNEEKNTFEARQIDFLSAAGQDVADGVTLLQKSFGSSGDDAAKLREAAAGQFDLAYKALATGTVVKG